MMPLPGFAPDAPPRPDHLGHVIATPGGNRTICGCKTKECGITWAPFVHPYIERHGAVFCPECLARMAAS